MKRSGIVLLWTMILILCEAGSASARLDENCTVSVLNRTARVKQDGGWVLPNVPANRGPVRARATCVENGVTRAGQSNFFTIAANGSVQVPQIVFQTPEPIPASLTLTAPSLTLPSAGATVQLTATATLPDGGTQNVTGGTTGTSYTTSNRAMATVSADGLVTAISSGVVIVSALNEGALALLQLRVGGSSGDTDGDGIPDDVEVANGLNPNDPTDAVQDADSDGLTNKQELVDYNTNPRVADTDGDGVRDGLEIQTGSNPLDPGSRNLAQALTAISVVPGAFTLINNTLLSPPARQLTVTGHLRDGSTIDLTATTTGTIYTTNDDAVCGLSGSRVVGGSEGTCTITVANSGFTAQAAGTVESFSPVALSSIVIPGFANNVDVSGDYAYVAAGEAGLQVVDVRNPRAPVIVGALDTPGNANDVRVVGTLAYVADGGAGLQIIEVSSPSAPILRGTFDTSGDARDVRVIGSYVYIADGEAGLQILEVSNPAGPMLLGSVDTPGMANGVDVSGTVAVVAEQRNDPIRDGLVTIDVSVPATPQVLARLETAGAVDVTLRGSLAYLAGGFIGQFQIVDIGVPTNPRLVSFLPILGNFEPADLDLFSRFVLAADALGVTTSTPNRIPITDVFDPGNPLFVASISLESVVPANERYGGTGVALTPQYVYTTGVLGDGLQNGATGMSRLFIGQYLKFPDDTAGVPPVVRIVTPSAGALVAEEAQLPIAVEATDDIGVASVDILVNGQVVAPGTDVFAYPVPLGATSLTIGAHATDAGDNVGVAPEVVVTVVPDTVPPEVRITAPTAGSTVTEQATLLVTVFAADNVAMASVDLLVNGQVVQTLTSEPYEFTITVPTGVSSLTLSARATDHKGQVATTAAVGVSVVPDTQPPTVQITAPVSGTTVTEGDFLSVTILASDNLSVTAVEVLLNGEVIETLTTPPYEMTLTVPVGVTTFTIGARAHDPKGNVGTATEVNVAVAPDTVAPIVQITAPSAGSTIRERSTIGISIDATDNVAATSFELLVDGQVVDTATFGFFNFVVPVGSTSLTLGAQVRDPAGNIGVAPEVVLTVIPDLAPTVQILTPASGTSAIERTTVRVEVAASDDVLLTGLEFLVDGQVVASKASAFGLFPPYRFKVPIPVGVTTLRLTVRASDNVAQVATSTEVIVNVTPDLGTTMTGRVVDQVGSPIIGARVMCKGRSGLSGADGTFTISGLPTIAGEITCVASSPTGSAEVKGGSTGAWAPIPGGTIGVGDVALFGVTGAPLYPAATQLLLGASVADVAVRDLNRDGNADLIVAGGGIRVQLGNGDGTFQTPLVVPAGTAPQALAPGDLNGDGLVDVVTADGNQRTTSVAVGNGDGTFQPPRSFAARDRVESVTVADFTGDGQLDVVTAASVIDSFFVGEVSLFVGNGDGTLQPRRHLSVGDSPVAVVAADLDRDGAMDLIVGNRGFFGGTTADVQVVLGNGDGSFEEAQGYSTGSGLSGLVVTDLDHDGVLDVVTANSGSGDAAILRGNGDGTLQLSVAVPVGVTPDTVVVTDVDFNGTTDLALTGGGTDFVVVLGTEEGTFASPQHYAVGLGVQTALAVGDLNGDRLPDFVIGRGGAVSPRLSLFFHR